MKKLKIYLIENILSTLKNLSFPNVDFTLSKPKNKSFGDLSSNLPLLIGNLQKKPPLDIGKMILKDLKEKKMKDIEAKKANPLTYANIRKNAYDFRDKKEEVKEPEKYEVNINR